jgi:hypothetical protein
VGQVIDRACADISDPAEVFAVSLRISGRLGWTHPDIARFLTGVGLESVDASRGLAPRALRDIRAGQAAGCFHRHRRADRAQRRGRRPARAAAVARADIRNEWMRHPWTSSAEACLRLLGVPAPEAARLAAASLPPDGAVSR